MAFRMECLPAFNYGRDTHDTMLVEHGACFASDALTLALGTGRPLRKQRSGVASDFTLNENEAATFVLGETEDRHCDVLLGDEDAEVLVGQTEAYWRHWLSQCGAAGARSSSGRP